MRLTILSSVSALVLLSLLPYPADAAFEFVAPKSAEKATRSVTPSDEITSDSINMAPVSESELPSAADMVKNAISPLSTKAAVAWEETNGQNTTPSETGQEMVVDAPTRIPPNMKAKRDAAFDEAPSRIQADIQELPPLADTAPVPLVPSYAPPAMPDPVMTSSHAPVAPTLPSPKMAAAKAPAPAFVPMQVATENTSSEAGVQGFGRDVPLVMALQQIVPAQYRYSFGDQINPGMRVSWTGGKPWRDVVSDVARRHSMNVDIVSNVVAFHRGAPPSAPAMMPSPVSQMASVVPKMPAPMMAAPAMPKPMPLTPAEVAPVAAPPMWDEPMPIASKPPVQRREVLASTTSAPHNIINENRLMDLISDSTPPQPKRSSYAAPVAMPTSPYGEVNVTTNTVTAVPMVPVMSEPMDAPMGTFMNAPMDMPGVQAESHALTPVIMSPAPVVQQEAKQVAPVNTMTPDPLMGDDKPAKRRIEDKKILTADASMAVMSLTEVQDIPSGFDMPMPIMPGPLPSQPSYTPRASSLPPMKASSYEPMPSAPSDISPAITSPTIVEPTPMIPPMSGSASTMVPGPRSSSYTPPSAPSVVTAAPMYAPVDVASAQEWVAYRGETLRQALTNWSGQSGVSLVWSSEYDYPLQTDIRLNSNYTTAVRTLLEGFSRATPRPLGRLFKNQTSGAQPVLVIETQRLTN